MWSKRVRDHGRQCEGLREISVPGLNYLNFKNPGKNAFEILKPGPVVWGPLRLVWP